jgi:hypothetical protein
VLETPLTSSLDSAEAKTSSNQISLRNSQARDIAADHKALNL